MVPNMSPETLMRVYRFMKLVRMLDERMIALQRQGRIGFYGAATGEEAAVIGSAAALESGDWVFPALRQGGVLLYRGCPLVDFICQIFANSGDLSKGHQMPCHYFHPKYHHVSWSSCIGTQLPQAVGAAYAAQYRQDKTVSVAYLGEGATSEGDFHIALNFAGVWKAPVVFFCQNNQWSISVPFAHQTASKNIAMKAAAYGIEGIEIDGNDAVACYETVKRAVDKARSGGGATLIEAVTYRLGAHSTSDDPRLYRDEKEVREWESRDPIPRFRKVLEEKKLWDAKKEEILEEDLLETLTRAIRSTEEMPPPVPSTLFQDVYKSNYGTT